MDIIGKKFFRLTVLEELKKTTKDSCVPYYKCQCDCGNIVFRRKYGFTKGSKQNCGCYNKEIWKEIRKRGIKQRTTSHIDIVGDLAYITLSRSDKKAIIDKEDIDKVKDYLWRLSNYGYVRTSTSRIAHGSIKSLSLHEAIMGKKEGLEIDHINRNPLDNRKCNLRFVTHAENSHNIRCVPNKNTGIKNIQLTKYKKYRARYQYNGVVYNLGNSFETIEEAKEALMKSYIENNVQYNIEELNNPQFTKDDVLKKILDMEELGDTDVDKIAKELKVAKRTAFNYLWEGKIKGEKVNNRWVVTDEEIEYVKKNGLRKKDPNLIKYSKEMRIELGLSQQELADKLGISICTVRGWEYNHSTPVIETQKKILNLIEEIKETRLHEN